MPRSKVPLETLERLSREARVRTPKLLGSNVSWGLLRWGLAAAFMSFLVALAMVIFHRDGPDSVIALLGEVVKWLGFAGLLLSFVGFFAPLLALAAIRVRGKDPQAIMADRRRGEALKFARFLADRLDRSSIDTARRGATAEISRFERRKFMHTLFAGAGAAVATVARGLGGEAAVWVDWVVLMGAALACGMTLGILATLDFIDRLNRILDALNEAEVILVARETRKAVPDHGRSVRSGLMALFDAVVRRVTQGAAYRA
ncbi:MULTISPECIES: hypothetical protein [unclassified Brevundimonas]|uniref:hypothetical protein n=1 Tax=unclassified Brevundimonas TaxID=2622653 RepID=UPI0025BE2959|nr:MULTISPECIES: hypothetical protein [unclassified Brevundimonas]